MVTIKYHAFMKKFAAYSDLITGKKITYNDAANFNLIGCDIIDAYQLSEITRPEYEALKGAFFLLKDAGKDALNPEQCIYTMQDWQNDREFRAVPGQEITGSARRFPNGGAAQHRRRRKAALFGVWHERLRERKTLLLFGTKPAL